MFSYLKALKSIFIHVIHIIKSKDDDTQKKLADKYLRLLCTFFGNFDLIFFKFKRIRRC